MNRDLHDMRQNYTKGFLLEESVDKDPMVQFHKWFSDAKSADLLEPNAMLLATANKEGVPSIRTVLLKELDVDGFIFYTNYESHKAKDIEENNIVSLVFLWLEHERQVRITGKAEKVSKERSNAYFQSRPRGSKLGAWVSPQSQVISNREVLTNSQKKIDAQFHTNKTIPIPDFWGGYKVQPTVMEFWQGRPSRLHDRLRYKVVKNGLWSLERLAP